MTPETDIIIKLLRQVAGKGTAVGFDDVADGDILDEVVQVGIVEGRRREVKTPDGQKVVTGRARLIRTPQGLVSIAGGEGAPISVGEANRLLGKEDAVRLAGALGRDRQRRKNKLQGKQ